MTYIPWNYSLLSLILIHMKKESIAEIKAFGIHVREIRTNLGISQEDLGFKSGLDRTYISGIERGLRNPALRNIYKIAKALEIEIKDLF